MFFKSMVSLTQPTFATTKSTRRKFLQPIC